MKRLPVSGLLVLAAWVTMAAPTAAQAPRAHLKSFVCQTAMDPAARAISITAVMRPLSGTSKLAMRFQLMRQKNRGTRPVSVSGRGLKSWITPMDPTLGRQPGDVWVVRHPVVNLLAPDLYRFVVTFRWFDSSGKVLGTAARSSPRCAQPELRPDLKVSTVNAVPLASGSDRYSVVIRNNGKTAAGPFDVQLELGSSPDQQVLSAEAADGLDPHSSTVLHFHAPACTAGEQITAIADPTGQVDDADPANNTLATLCPSS